MLNKDVKTCLNNEIDEKGTCFDQSFKDHYQICNNGMKSIFHFTNTNLNECSSSIDYVNSPNMMNVSASSMIEKKCDLQPLNSCLDDHNDVDNNDSIKNDDGNKNISEKRFQKKPFTAEEDKTLLSIINSVGEKNWGIISMFMKQMNYDRNGRQCRDRYFHYLDPKISPKSKWTAEEDELLLKTVESNGKKWKMMEKIFPGRSEVSLRNRYHLVLRKKIKNERGADRKQNIMSKTFAFLDNFNKRSRKPQNPSINNKKVQNTSRKISQNSNSINDIVPNQNSVKEAAALNNNFFTRSYKEANIFSLCDDDINELFNFEEIYFM